VPDHRGLVLSSAITVELDAQGLALQRTGTGLSMRIQAKDCAQGGIFQMEPQRSDGSPQHRERRVPPLRRADSSQVATRVPQPACNTATPVTPSGRHCGGMSVWDVASGGRLRFVTGEDSTEVANPPTVCTSKCPAQNQVRGRLVVLGHPFPVPWSRLVPGTAALPVP
jgi:hypothetical protein